MKWNECQGLKMQKGELTPLSQEVDHVDVVEAVGDQDEVQGVISTKLREAEAEDGGEFLINVFIFD
jgi:hypothetical protein